MTRKEYYKRLTSELEANFKTYTKLNEEYDKLTLDRQSGDYSADYINQKIYPRQAELRRAMESTKRKASEDVKKVTADMGSYLKSLDTLKSEELNDDVRLFNTGITLNQKDIQDIINRNADNRTMIQLALRYANEKGIEGFDHTRYASAASQMNDFRNFSYAADTVIKWFDRPDGYESMNAKLLGKGSDLEAFCMEEED